MKAIDIADNKPETNLIVSMDAIFKARKAVLEMHMNADIEEYIVQLVLATRSPKKYSVNLASHLQFGVSPRATISLDRCARAHAFLSGRDYVKPADVHAVLPDVMRHRILRTYEAEAQGVSADDIVKELIELVPVA